MQHSLDLNSFLLKPDLPPKAGVEHVQAWLEYKAKKLMDNGKKVTDPDCSDAAREFYTIMWDDFLEDTGFELRPEPRVFSKNPEQYVQGDWMCSVWTTLKRGLELSYEKNNHGEKLWEQEPYMSSLDEKSVTERTYAEILNHFKEFSDVFGDATLQNFIRSAYTFANLIIVPDGFNVARSRPTDDYWDKTLEEYFINQEALQCETKKEDCKTLFHDLVKASRDKCCDRLFLDEWFYNDKKSIKMLPNKKLTKLDWPDGWHALMQEMTDRIDNRRVQMQVRINELMKR